MIPWYVILTQCLTQLPVKYETCPEYYISQLRRLQVKYLASSSLVITMTQCFKTRIFYLAIWLSLADRRLACDLIVLRHLICSKQTDSPSSLQHVKCIEFQCVLPVTLFSFAIPSCTHMYNSCKYCRLPTRIID